MKPRLLALGALAVTLLLVGLWWSTTRENPPAPVVTAPAETAPVTTAAPTPPVKDDRHILKPMAPAAPATEPRLAERPKVFVRADGTRVHDLRDQEAPGRPSPVSQPTVQLLLATGAPLVAKCAEPYTRAGNRGRLTAVVSLEVVAGKLKIADTKVNSDSIEDAAVKDCVKQAFTGLSLDAPAGQEDMTYRLSLPFRVP